MLDRMENAGLVERIPDTSNRRQIFVSITEKALKYQKQYDKLSDDMNAIFYAGFTDDEIVDFEKKLKKILGNFESRGD